MYERSAIVLEKYFNKIFGFNEKNNSYFFTSSMYYDTEKCICF